MIECGFAAGVMRFLGEGLVLSEEDRGHCFGNIRVRALLDGGSRLCCTLLLRIRAFLPMFRSQGDVAFAFEAAFLFLFFIARKAYPDAGPHNGSSKPGALNFLTAFRALRAG